MKNLKKSETSGTSVHEQSTRGQPMIKSLWCNYYNVFKNEPLLHFVNNSDNSGPMLIILVQILVT